MPEAPKLPKVSIALDGRVPSAVIERLIRSFKDPMGFGSRGNTNDSELADGLPQLPRRGPLWTAGSMITGSGPGRVRPGPTYKTASAYTPVKSLLESSSMAHNGQPTDPIHRFSYGLGSTTRGLFDKLTADGAWAGDSHPGLGFLQGGAIGAPAAAGATWLYNLLTGGNAGYTVPTIVGGAIGAGLGSLRAANAGGRQ